MIRHFRHFRLAAVGVRVETRRLKSPAKDLPMRTQLEKALSFHKLHQGPATFVIPNPWDAGTAKILESLGFEALATTSAGLAYTLGRVDGQVTRDEALANAAAICAATRLPVSADFENLYAHAPDIAAAMIPAAAATGLVGCSIEDATGDAANPIYPFDVAVARVKAAVAAARALPFPFILTARAENFLHGRKDMADTIARLQAYDAAGADCLYAPGLGQLDQFKAVVQATTKPINGLVPPLFPDLTVAGLASVGVRRISVGAGLARAALGGFLAAAEEIKNHGTFTYGRSQFPPDRLHPILKKDPA
jgi:2-methylisocitrate lyase-like PEP mutase family enzyme